MKKETMARLILGFILTLMLTTFIGEEAFSQTKTVELKLAAFVPSTGVEYKGVLDPWAKLVEKSTDGRVKVRIYPSESLSKARDIYDNVVSGFADVGDFNQWFHRGRFPRSEIIEMPLSPWSNDVRIANFVIQKLYDEGYLKDDYKDVKVIDLHNFTPLFVHTTKKPIRTLEDFKGMKMSTAGNITQMVVTAFGGTPIPVPPPELYIALQRGTVDGTIWSWTGLNTFKLHELVKYHTFVGVNIGSFGLVMNKEKWASLSPSDQNNIDSVSGLHLTTLAGKAWYAEDMASLAKAKKIPGNEIIYLSQEEMERWRARVQPIWNKWVDDMESKGLPGKKLVDAALRIAKEYKE